jgi:hypothetical protein
MVTKRLHKEPFLFLLIIDLADILGHTLVLLFFIFFVSTI